MFDSELEEFIVNRNIDGIKTVLVSKPTLIDKKTSLGVSPLMLSCYYKLPDVTQILLSYLTQINIFEAASADKFDVVAHEIFKNPNAIDTYSEDGFTPLGLACYFGNEEIARYLVLKGADVNLPSQNGFYTFPLHAAIAGNFSNIAKMLIDNNANVNCIQKNGITPLHIAAENGNIEVIIKLLEKDAMVNMRMEGGKLPADLAFEKGYDEIGEILSS